MAELENLLLQAAGRTGTSASKNQSYDSNNSKFNKRKHSESKFSLKKNLGGSTEKDKIRNRFNGDESDSAPSIGSDLKSNEEKKKQPSKLLGLAREAILAGMSVNVDDHRLKKRERDSTTEKSPPFTSDGGSSVRKEKSAAKSDALNELRAKRMKQQKLESYHRLKDTAGVTVSSSGYGNLFRSPDANSSDSDDGRDGKFHQDTDIDDDIDDLLESKSRQIRYEDVREITIRRSKLAKWLMEPFFEEIVAGCFVRVGIGRSSKGPKYRLCVIKNVDGTELNRRYKLEGRTTYKWLNCVWGSEASAARWQMAMVSDSPPTEEEFDEWLTEMKRNGCHIPCLQDVDDKKEELLKARSFVYSAKTVKKMVEEKKSTSSIPRNVAVEKNRFREEIEAAEIAGKVSEAESLRAKLKDMVDLARQVKPVDARALKLMEMNLKNRAENLKKASAFKPDYSDLNDSESAYDPFTRKTICSRPRRYAKKPKSNENEETMNGGNDIKPTEATEQAKDDGKRVNTTAPVNYAAELMSLHDFDLPISLAALQKLGEEDGLRNAFMARKQKIEASIGYRVPNDYGNRNVLTLSISDYKRRRGLLRVGDC